LQEQVNPFLKEVALQLPGLEYMAGIADLYLETVRRFGRFPHRNAILGRVSTPEELKFLEDGGADVQFGTQRNQEPDD